MINTDGKWIMRPHAVDHLVPERIAMADPKGPHAPVNLLCACASCHAKKRRAEDKLCKNGDLLTYLAELRRLGWPMERVYAALSFYGVRHVGWAA